MSELEAARIIMEQARKECNEAMNVTIRASRQEADRCREYQTACREWERLQLASVLNYEI